MQQCLQVATARELHTGSKGEVMPTAPTGKATPKLTYAAPRLTVYGGVGRLTREASVDKKFGPTDGFTFMGEPISNAS